MEAKEMKKPLVHFSPIVFSLELANYISITSKISPTILYKVDLATSSTISFFITFRIHVRNAYTESMK